jgi:hypothetical protein
MGRLSLRDMGSNCMVGSHREHPELSFLRHLRQRNRGRTTTRAGGFEDPWSPRGHGGRVLCWNAHGRDEDLLARAGRHARPA